MNTDNNKRYQDTEKKILAAYGRLVQTEEPLKITVTQICQEAGIHRTTFYGHFQDVPDVLGAIQQQNMERLFHYFFTEEGWNLEAGLQKQIRFLYQNRKVIKRQFESDSPDNRYLTFSIALEDEKYLESYKRHFQLTTDQEVAYHREYMSGGMMAIIRKWAGDDFREPPENIASYMVRFFNLE